MPNTERLFPLLFLLEDAEDSLEKRTQGSSEEHTDGGEGGNYNPYYHAYDTTGLPDDLACGSWINIGEKHNICSSDVR
jgi:hypothetical protein